MAQRSIFDNLMSLNNLGVGVADPAYNRRLQSTNQSIFTKPTQTGQVKGTQDTAALSGADPSIFGAPIRPTAPTSTTATTGSGAGLGGGGAGSGLGNNVGDYLNIANQFNQNTSTGSNSYPEIDSAYEEAFKALDASGQALQSSAQANTDQAQADLGPTKTGIQQEGDRRVGELTDQATGAQRRGEGTIDQVRQLYNELNQGNIARLSAGGISSSSVADALAERLGRDTAQRIAGVTDNTNEVLNNIEKEKGRVRTFTQAKLDSLDEQLKATKELIQSQLQQALAQLGSQRAGLAGDKATRRAELAQQAKQVAADQQNQATHFAQQLYVWNLQRTAALEDAKSYVTNQTQGANYSQFFQDPSTGKVTGYNKTTGQIEEVPGAAPGILKLGTGKQLSDEDKILKEAGVSI